jgi:hypothetical protein
VTRRPALLTRRPALWIDAGVKAALVGLTPLRWWDGANHFVNWGILVTGFGQLLVRLRLSKWTVVGLAIGFGGVTAILWEFLEYVTFIRHSSELRTAYTDTLGDLGLGLCGSVVAAALTVTVLWPKDRPLRTA